MFAYSAAIAQGKAKDEAVKAVVKATDDRCPDIVAVGRGYRQALAGQAADRAERMAAWAQAAADSSAPPTYPEVDETLRRLERADRLFGLQDDTLKFAAPPTTPPTG